MLKSWVEDFVDEDTGEVVSIERNEVIFDRETVLEPEHIEEIIESGSKTILLHKESEKTSDFAIIHRLRLVMLLTNCSSRTSVMT